MKVFTTTKFLIEFLVIIFNTVSIISAQEYHLKPAICKDSVFLPDNRIVKPVPLKLEMESGPGCVVGNRENLQVDQLLSRKGYQPGEYVPDFTLQNINGSTFHLKEALGKKPILIVTGAYTCPLFRSKVYELNDLCNKYGNLIDIYLVYVSEPHPNNEYGYYFNSKDPIYQNQQEKIDKELDTTMAERKAAAEFLKATFELKCEVLLDDDSDNFLKNFGYSSNMAYLINPEGLIVQKHVWFNKPPDNMSIDIEMLLGDYKNLVVSPGKNFALVQPGDHVISFPHSAAMYHAQIKNLSHEPLPLKLMVTSGDWEVHLIFNPDEEAAEDNVWKDIILKPYSSYNVFVLAKSKSDSVGSMSLLVMNGSEEKNTIVQKVGLQSFVHLRPNTSISEDNLAVQILSDFSALFIENAKDVDSWNLTVYSEYGAKIFNQNANRLSYLTHMPPFKKGLYKLVFKNNNGEIKTFDYYVP